MKLAREDFEGLEVGTEITTDSETFTFQFINIDTVFMLDVNKEPVISSIFRLIDDNATIQKKNNIYQGWEIGDYTGKNVWVKVSDESEMEAMEKKEAVLLSCVTKEGFVDSYVNSWEYAVQLTEVNTQNLCNTQ